MLERAAGDAGWDVIVCDDSNAGWTAVKRQRFQLALVDFEESSECDELKLLSSEISEMRNTLLMLCGNEGDALEEIWARQLGSWLYLPGVSEGSDVTSLCEQAIPVAEKLTGIPGKVTH
jgi:ActR/RegA family two-component response regulator